jgi:dolichol-phosphate mannosyltransferase
MNNTDQLPLDDLGTHVIESGIRVVVVIACYRVKAHVLDVIERVPWWVSHVLVVDDACPEKTGAWVKAECRDPRVEVLMREVNGGVGAALCTGYARAVERNADVVVKVDGDGQMAPELLPMFVRPILLGRADYTKGNRFIDADAIAKMPRMRLLGNLVLSFMCKASSGYWHIFDPTNGFTAIDGRVLVRLPIRKLARRYFFESDMLFRLGCLRAVVEDVPMFAHYPHSESSLSIPRVIGPFAIGHLRNFLKRLIYNYYLRDFSPASLLLPIGLGLTAFGTVFGAFHWWQSIMTGITTPAGTVMLAALPLLVGIQFLLAFFSADVQVTPRIPLASQLSNRIKKAKDSSPDRLRASAH